MNSAKAVPLWDRSLELNMGSWQLAYCKFVEVDDDNGKATHSEGWGMIKSIMVRDREMTSNRDC
jgi:hypothetical protein